MQPLKEFDHADFFMLCEFLKLAIGIVEAVMVSSWWSKGHRGVYLDDTELLLRGRS